MRVVARWKELMPLVVTVSVAATSLGCNKTPERDLVELPGHERVGLVLLEELRTTLDSAQQAGAVEQRARHLGELGIQLAGHQVYDTAVRTFELATDLAPSQFEWWFLRGYVEFQLGDMAKAEASFDRACALEPSDVPCLVWRVQTLLQLGEPARAREILEAKFPVPSNVAYVSLLRGDIASALGEWRVASNAYQGALELQPSASALHRALARVERMQGNDEKARLHLAQAGPNRVSLADPWVSRVLESDQSPLALMKRGRAALAAQDAAQAQRLFRAAGERAPQDAAGPYNEGVVLLRGRNVPGAIERFREALSRDENHLDGLLALGALLYRQGDVAEGVKLLERARSLGSRDPQLGFHLGSAYLTAGEPERAVTVLEEAVQDDASVGERVIERLVVAASRSGDDRRALELVERACAEGACGLALQIAQVRLLAAARQPATANAARSLVLARALRRRSQDAEVGLALAEALAANGEFDAAAELMGQLEAAAAGAGQSALAGKASVARSRYVERVRSTTPGL